MKPKLLILISLTGLWACQGVGVQGDPGKVLSLPTPNPELCPSGYVGGSTFIKGNGSATNPFIVCTESDLILITSLASGGHPEYLSKNYLLGTDIDLACNNFTTQIGSPSLSFTGVFDGGNHTINNYLNYSSDPSKDYSGLFGAIGNDNAPPGQARAGVKNLNITILYINGRNFVGALSGWAVNADIENVSVSNGSCASSTYPTEVQGTGSIGGLVGALGSHNEINGATLSNSTSSVRVWANPTGINIGGLVGSVGSKSQISDSSASGIVSCGGSTTGIGGLVGGVDGGGGVTTSYSTVSSICGTSNVGGLVGLLVQGGSVSKSYAIINQMLPYIPSSFVSLGGLVGDNEGAISLSYAQTQSGAPKNTIGGGLVGQLGSSGTIKNSYSRMDATVSGALVGTIAISSVSIKNSFAAGTMAFASYSCYTGTCTNNGGLVGPTGSIPGVGTLTGSFWEKGSVYTNDPNARDSVWMRQFSNYSSAGWDISIWKWSSLLNDQLPYLSENLPQ